MPLLTTAVVLGSLGGLFWLLYIKGVAWQILLLTLVPYCFGMALKAWIPALGGPAITLGTSYQISWGFFF